MYFYLLPFSEILKETQSINIFIDKAQQTLIDYEHSLFCTTFELRKEQMLQPSHVSK